MKLVLNPEVHQFSYLSFKTFRTDTGDLARDIRRRSSWSMCIQLLNFTNGQINFILILGEISDYNWVMSSADDESESGEEFTLWDIKDNLDTEPFEVVLKGGSPWDFTITGGIEVRSPIQILEVSQYINCFCFIFKFKYYF